MASASGEVCAERWQWERAAVGASPSRADGISEETEERYRREGARLIMDVGAALKLSPYPTLATAAVYYHRFYMFHSYREFSRHLTSLSCVFLAGKVEETPKKCRDIVQAARERLSDAHFAALGKNPSEELMSVERVLLRTIKFDLRVVHPYQFLLQYAKIFRIADKHKLQKMLQMAWTFVNDSLCTSLCLQWQPEVIAIALMYLASRLSKVEVNDWAGRRGGWGEKWWDQFVSNMTQELMEDICHQVLDLYSSTSAARSAAGGGDATPGSAPTTPRPPPANTASGVGGQQVPVLGSATPAPVSVKPFARPPLGAPPLGAPPPPPPPPQPQPLFAPGVPAPNVPPPFYNRRPQR